MGASITCSGCEAVCLLDPLLLTAVCAPSSAQPPMPPLTPKPAMPYTDTHLVLYFFSRRIDTDFTFVLSLILFPVPPGRLRVRSLGRKIILYHLARVLELRVI